MNLNHTWLTCASVFVEESKVKEGETKARGFYTDYAFAIKGKGMGQPKITLRLSKLNPLGLLPGQQYKLSGTVATIAVKADGTTPLLSAKDQRQIINLKPAEGSEVTAVEWKAVRIHAADFRIRVSEDGHVLPESFDRACDAHTAAVAAADVISRARAVADAAKPDGEAASVPVPAESLVGNLPD